MLSFSDSTQKTLEDSGRETTLRISINFPGYKAITLHDGALATGSTITLTATDGTHVLTEGTNYTATSSNSALALQITNYINSNIRTLRATYEVLGDGVAATSPARLIIMATRKHSTVDATVAGGSGTWATELSSPTSGWSYNSVTGADTVAGYSAGINSIGDFGDTLDPVDRSCSSSNIEIILAMEERLRWALTRFGIRDAPVDIYFLAKNTRQPGVRPGTVPVWQKIHSYWARDAVPVEQGAAIRLDVIGISDYLNERKVAIPSFLGRHPLQAMQLLLNEAGFTIGSDPRIDWASFNPTTDPTRGHFNMSYYRDTANSLNVETVEEADRYEGLWDLLQELVMLTGGTLRLNAAGQLEHIPYDEDAPAIETWDLNADTGFDGEPPEVEETEAFLTNKVNWDFAQAQGATQISRLSDTESADESRGAYFTLEDQDSLDVYGEEHEVGFSTRWLNSASAASYPYGATGAYYDTGSGLGMHFSGHRTGYVSQAGQETQKKVVSTLWHDISGNAAGGWYGLRLPQDNSYVSWAQSEGIQPSGQSNVTLFAWIHTRDGYGIIAGVFDNASSGDGWALARENKNLKLLFRVGGVVSSIETVGNPLETLPGFFRGGGKQWFSVCAVFSSGTVTLHINNVQVSTTTTGTLPTTWPTPDSSYLFRLGPGATGGTPLVVNNVMYWSAALNASQRTALHRPVTSNYSSGNNYLPKLSYTSQTGHPDPNWWFKAYDSYYPEVGSSVAGNPFNVLGQDPTAELRGAEFGIDTACCLHTAATSGFCGTRTQMPVPGPNSGGVTEVTAITPEDSVADLDDSAGRVAYIMFEPHEQFLHESIARPVSDVWQSFTLDESLENDTHYLLGKSSYFESENTFTKATFKAEPEIAKVSSYRLFPGAPVYPFDATQPSTNTTSVTVVSNVATAVVPLGHGFQAQQEIFTTDLSVNVPGTEPVEILVASATSIEFPLIAPDGPLTDGAGTIYRSLRRFLTRGSAISYAGPANAEDPSRSYRLPVNIWMSIDTSYNSEGFRAGRGGFGTFPPRVDTSIDFEEKINIGQRGGWHLEGVQNANRSRVVDATIPAYRSKEVLSRFKFGAWRLTVRTPLDKMRFQIGDVVSINYDAFFAYGRTKLDGTVTFEIVGKQLSFSESDVSIEWDLVKLKDSGQPSFVPIGGLFNFPPRPISPNFNPFSYSPVTDNALTPVGIDSNLDGSEDETVYTL